MINIHNIPCIVNAEYDIKEFYEESEIYESYEEAREQAILKAIELIK